MEPHELVVRAVRDGRICTLVIEGDLDFSSAAEATDRAARATDDSTARLVLNLGGVTFLDCAGARALVGIAELRSSGCPVIVSSISQAAYRLLELLSFDLRNLWPTAPAPSEEAKLFRQAEALRSSLADVLEDMARVAVAVAATEERLAGTFAQMAGQWPPERTARLTVLSEQARRGAVHSLILARHYQFARSSRQITVTGGAQRASPWPDNVIPFRR